MVKNKGDKYSKLITIDIIYVLEVFTSIAPDW